MITFSFAGNLPPTVELNALAMKRGELTVYTIRHAPPATPQQYFQHGFGNIPRIFNPHYPGFTVGCLLKPEKLYLVTLKVSFKKILFICTLPKKRASIDIVSNYCLSRTNVSVVFAIRLETVSLSDGA